MKKIVLVVACSASLVLPSVAFADETVVAPQVQQTQDLSAVFATDDVNQLQVATLSTKEMQETEGAWLQFAGLGIVGGGFGYLGYVSSVPKDQRTFNGYALAVGSGAAGGVIGGLPIQAHRALFLGSTVGYVGNQAAVRK